MKIGSVGAGAMGRVYGGILGDAGNEVWLLDVWEEHIEVIRARGIRVEGASGDRTVRVNATLDARAAGPCELVAVATKAMDAEAGVNNARPMIGPDTQEGWIQGARLRGHPAAHLGEADGQRRLQRRVHRDGPDGG